MGGGGEQRPQRTHKHGAAVAERLEARAAVVRAHAAVADAAEMATTDSSRVMRRHAA